jgi:hypothetical protein
MHVKTISKPALAAAKVDWTDLSGKGSWMSGVSDMMWGIVYALDAIKAA